MAEEKIRDFSIRFGLSGLFNRFLSSSSRIQDKGEYAVFISVPAKITVGELGIRAAMGYNVHENKVLAVLFSGFAFGIQTVYIKSESRPVSEASTASLGALKFVG
jgi:hypothetical protein